MASDSLCLASTILIFDVEWEKTAVYKLPRLSREKCVLFACNQVVKRTRHSFGECRALRQYSTLQYSGWLGYTVTNSVADPGCLSGSRDPTFFHPGSEFFPSRIRIEEFKYFNPKKWIQSSRKYEPGCSSRIPIRILTF